MNTYHRTFFWCPPMAIHNPLWNPIRIGFEFYWLLEGITEVNALLRIPLSAVDRINMRKVYLNSRLKRSIYPIIYSSNKS